MNKKLEADTALSHDRIDKQIGVGGWARFIWRRTRNGRQVALKVLPVELIKNEERWQRFEREAQAASSLNHRAAHCRHRAKKNSVSSE